MYDVLNGYRRTRLALANCDAQDAKSIAAMLKKFPFRGKYAQGMFECLESAAESRIKTGILHRRIFGGV
jgi:hypothetical protein